jgi:hypothetical protein
MVAEDPRRREMRTEIIKTVIIVIITVPLTIIVTNVIDHIKGPPSDEIVMRLMDQEVAAGMGRNVDLAGIYAMTATVMDAGCRTPGSGVVWSGLTAIEQRYRSLSQFDGLSHANRIITWIPNNRRAARASATADTVGATRSADGKATPISGHELWEFAPVNGTWLITSFTYNLCPP